jgi:hypothetical protein
MGLQSGSMSWTRYHYGTFQVISRTVLNEAFIKCRAMDLSSMLKGYPKEVRLGWVKPSAMYDYERSPASWEATDGLTPEGVLLCMRVERRKVPSELFQNLYKETVRSILLKEASQTTCADYTVEDRRGGVRINRQKLKDDLKRDLMQRSLPTLTYVEALWHEDGHISLFTHSKTLKTYFSEWFVHTFAAVVPGELRELLPPLLAFSAEGWHADAQVRLVESLKPLLPEVLWAH